MKTLSVETRALKYIQKHPEYIIGCEYQTYRMQEYVINNNKNYVCYKFIKDPQYSMIEKMIKNCPAFIRDIEADEYLILVAIRKCPKLISLLKNPTDHVKSIAVKIDPYTIQYIDSPSLDLQEIAINICPYAIQYIKSPTDAMQYLAISICMDGSTIKFIKNQSLDAQKLAIRKCSHNIQYISPTDKNYKELCSIALDMNGMTLKYMTPSYELITKAIKNTGLAIQYVKFDKADFNKVDFDGVDFSKADFNYYQLCLDAIRSDRDAISFINKDYLSEDQFKTLLSMAIQQESILPLNLNKVFNNSKQDDSILDFIKNEYKKKITNDLKDKHPVLLELIQSI